MLFNNRQSLFSNAFHSVCRHRIDFSFLPYYILQLQQIQNQEEEQEERLEEETPFIEDSSPDGSQELLLPGYARYIPQRERLAQEDKAFFTPSTIPGWLYSRFKNRVTVRGKVGGWVQFLT